MKKTLRLLIGVAAAAVLLLTLPAVGEIASPSTGASSAPPEGTDPTQPPHNGSAAAGTPSETKPPETATAATDPPAGEDTSSAPSEESGEAAAEPPASMPDLMAQRLSEAGFEPSDITGSQLIIVKSSGSSARVSAFERVEGNVWNAVLEECSGHVGRSGVSASKSEGDGATPMGLFPLPSAFGNEPDPGCLLPYRQATSKSYWVDDPASASYNTWVEDDGTRDWTSAEHISDYSAAYAYAAVIGYNCDPITPGAGSAIFLHVGSNPTSGCVSVSRADLLTLLRWLDPEKDPKILIF